MMETKAFEAEGTEKLAQFLAHGERTCPGWEVAGAGECGPLLWDVRMNPLGNYWVRLAVPTHLIPRVHLPYWNLFVMQHLPFGLSARSSCGQDYFIRGECWAWAEAKQEKEQSAAGAREQAVGWADRLLRSLRPGNLK